MRPKTEDQAGLASEASQVWVIGWKQLAILGLVAALASVPRFGERENPSSLESDSDIYIQMAEGYVSGTFATLERIGPPWHYNRPLLPFVSAQLVRMVPHLRVEHAMSFVSVLSAFLTAVLIVVGCRVARFCPGAAIFAGVSYLVGFPQLNWGYNLLTDSLGYAMAALAFAGYLVVLSAVREGCFKRAHAFAFLTVLVQIAAFFARETAWMTPVAATFVSLFVTVKDRKIGKTIWALTALLFVAKLPHGFYSAHYDLVSPPIHFRPEACFRPAYLLDAIVKSGVAFHVAWPVSILGFGLGRRWKTIPVWLLSWSAAGLLYAGAGFLHNTLAQGYPLRMTYAVAPVVYAGCLCALDRARRKHQIVLGLSFLLLYAIVSFIGVYLDPGTPQIRAIDYVP